GALWMVIYSFFRGRKRTETKAVETIAAAAREVPRVETAPVRTHAKIEFVNFKGEDVTSTPLERTVVLADEPWPDSNRRNRSEIIRLARQMLLNNTSDEKIKQALPITDGELAMINNGVKHG
ncbi:MAG: hypothetical protein ACOYVF_01305, partial [Candidatus Zixiibacteriota bacterium]